MTPCLYRGRFCLISDLAATIIWDINPWLPHQARFGWGYVAMNATLWIDLRDHFAMEHHEEWTEQKEQEWRSQRPGERYGSGVQGPHYKETGG